jgi:hypothetical protein
VLSAFIATSGVVTLAAAQAPNASDPAREPTAAAAREPSSAAVDGGPSSPPASAETEDNQPKLVFRSSTFYWDHSATAQTLGVGSDYQSRNPNYEMAFGLRPRYYFHDAEHESLSVRGDIALVREFTNSDATTREGEWTFTDTELWLAYVRTLNDTPDQTTDLIVRAPQLSLPTSKVSSSNGKILGLGFGLGVEQAVPLRGRGSRFLASARARANARYRYQFASSVVPTNEGIERVRLGPDGRSLPGDQLSGSAFADHEISGDLSVEPEILPGLTLLTELGLRYAHRRALHERIDVCGVVSTGCALVETRDDASRYGIASVFTVELGYEVRDELGVALGYTNLAPQLGADGQRRQPFYSQDARGYVTVTLALDELYLTAAGRRSGQESAASSEQLSGQRPATSSEQLSGQRPATSSEQLSGQRPATSSVHTASSGDRASY